MRNCSQTRTVVFETGVSLVGLFASFTELAGLLIHHRAEKSFINHLIKDNIPSLPGVHSVGVHGVEISLVEIYEEHNIVPEAGDTVGSGHCDDEGKEII